MQQRHRVPTIFSIYMLDVICCALGCVVLLWQVAHQEAEQARDNAETQSAAAQESRKDAERQSASLRMTQRKFENAHQAFVSASSDATQLQSHLADLRKKHLSVSQTLALTEKEREEARLLAQSRLDEIAGNRKLLALGEAQLKKLQDDLAKSLADDKKTNAELTGQLKLSAELLARLAAAEKQAAALKSDIASKQIDLDGSTKKLEQQIVLLKLTEENARKLQKLLDTLQLDHKDAQTRLKLTELQIKVREQELDQIRGEFKVVLAAKEKLGKELSTESKELIDAKSLIDALASQRDLLTKKLQLNSKELSSAASTIGDLAIEKSKLNKRVLDLQTEVEQRFAGIPLTGESVIFLIDVSGSMKMSDSKTDDPDKWPFLCETLMKLMRSIPTMKRFQVILFSDKVSYLFGNRDFWLKYEGAETAKATRDALKKFEVGGNTNMYDGFDEAFRYRKSGLDTIYLFSDGLPNAGEGLPASVRNPTEEQLNSYLGKFVRSKLKNDWNRPIAGKEAVRINAIGFYFESPDVGAFLWAMTREHRGSFVGLR